MTDSDGVDKTFEGLLRVPQISAARSATLMAQQGAERLREAAQPSLLED